MTMSSVRKTISLPPSVAKRLDEEAKRRRMSVSAVVADLVQRKEPEQLSYAALIDDDEDLSQRVDAILERMGR